MVPVVQKNVVLRYKSTGFSPESRNGPLFEKRFQLVIY